jgi:nitroreductase
VHWVGSIETFWNLQAWGVGFIEFEAQLHKIDSTAARSATASLLLSSANCVEPKALDKAE